MMDTLPWLRLILGTNSGDSARHRQSMALLIVGWPTSTAVPLLAILLSAVAHACPARCQTLEYKQYNKRGNIRCVYEWL